MKGWRWVGVALIAAGLRLPQLEIRPMHGDEAVMAVKAGAMRWGGEGAKYDPAGYHGTLLGWLTQPVLILSGAKSLAETDERHFRIVTAVCGILLCLTPMLLSDGLGDWGSVIAGLLLAVSPAFVYWSRFYIQEVPLVLATALLIGCGWRFSRSKRTGWLWGAAGSAGLMLCLKETAWLTFIAGGIGLAAVKPGRKWIGRNWTRLVWPGALALAIPALILGPSALLAPTHYWQLGFTGGDHAHPWHWYATAVLGASGGGRELPLGMLAFLPLPGATPAVRFLRIFAGALALGYAVLPYKTPWCALEWWLPIVWLAGAAAARFRFPLARVVGIAVLVWLGWWVYRTSFEHPADRGNPFVYAQPVEDGRRLGSLMKKISVVHPKGREMIIAVEAGNPWPLPWEFRGFPNVGYWAPGDPASRDAFRVAAVRIRPATPASRGLMFGLRPGEILSVEADPRLLDGALRRR